MTCPSHPHPLAQTPRPTPLLFVFTWEPLEVACGQVVSCTCPLLSRTLSRTLGILPYPVSCVFSEPALQ